MSTAIALKVTEIAESAKMQRRGNRWVGACPECGGSHGSTRFNLWDDGGYKCHSCQFSGDIIGWLRKYEGLSCSQAHQQVEKECVADRCPVWDSCRMGGNTGSRAWRPRSITPQQRTTSNPLPTSATTSPKEQWLAWATALHAASVQALLTNRDELAYLTGRGITMEMVKRFRLGWLADRQHPQRAAIGLPPREDGKKTLWVPEGLVIPFFDEAGKMTKIRIRRPEKARKTFLPELKYLEIEGSGKGAMVVRPQSGIIRGVVVVEAELDGMACASHDEVLIISLTTAGAGIDEQLAAEVAAAPVVLVALDADDEAGPKAVKRWLDTYRQAKYWPVPIGKDPGDYAQAGGDIRQWIESGLAPKVLAKCSEQVGKCSELPTDVALVAPESFSGSMPAGGEGERVITLTMLDGRTVYVVETREMWEQYYREGKIVFSANEMERLQQAIAAMNDAERAKFLSLTLDIKETFNEAWIRRGAAA